jgi:hypothetical protein
MVNIDEIIVRASQSGEICKPKGLGKTGEKLARKIYLEHKYGRVKSFTSKYTDKGTKVEESSIKELSDYLQRDFKKNEVRITNYFFTGECDIDDESTDTIIDVKNAWDLFTFDDAKHEINQDYVFQGRAYMNLYNRSNFKLIHILSDAPLSMILDTLHREDYKWQDFDTPEWRKVQIISEMVFTEDNFMQIISDEGLGGDEFTDKLINRFVPIPIEDRIFIREFTAHDETLKFMQSRVIDMRNYLKTIYG